MFMGSFIWFCLAFIASFFVFANATCDTATVPNKVLSMTFQHVQGTPKTTSYAHMLTNSQSNDGQICSGISPSMVLDAAYMDCTLSCLVSLTPYMYTNGTDFVDIVMLKDDQVSLYPGYSDFNAKIFCASTKGYCGATVPIFNFVSTKYSDHYTSSDTVMEDSTYGYDNSAIPQCYGWALPTTEADKLEQANYYSASEPPECDVFAYFKLKRPVSTSTTPATTNTASTSSSSTVPTSTATTSGSTSSASKTSVASTSAAVTTVASTSSITASSNNPTTTTLSVTTVITTPAADATTTPAAAVTTTTKAPVPVTDSSGNPVTDESGNTVTVPPVTIPPNPVTDESGVPVTDSSGNTATYPPAKDDQSKRKGGLAVWVWVVMGVGIGVLAIAIAGLAFFIRSNFNARPSRGTINPYDRDLYSTDGMYDVPPVPVQTMPAQAAANVGSAANGAHYAGIGVAQSSVV